MVINVLWGFHKAVCTSYPIHVQWPSDLTLTFINSNIISFSFASHFVCRVVLSLNSFDLIFQYFSSIDKCCNVCNSFLLKNSSTCCLPLKEGNKNVLTQGNQWKMHTVCIFINDRSSDIHSSSIQNPQFAHGYSSVYMLLLAEEKITPYA